MSDHQKFERIRVDIEYTRELENIIEQARDTLALPLDEEKVLNNPWGRSLWHASLARQAEAVLNSITLRKKN